MLCFRKKQFHFIWKYLLELDLALKLHLKTGYRKNIYARDIKCYSGLFTGFLYPAFKEAVKG